MVEIGGIDIKDCYGCLYQEDLKKWCRCKACRSCKKRNNYRKRKDYSRWDKKNYFSYVNEDETETPKIISDLDSLKKAAKALEDLCK